MHRITIFGLFSVSAVLGAIACSSTNTTSDTTSSNGTDPSATKDAGAVAKDSGTTAKKDAGSSSSGDNSNTTPQDPDQECASQGAQACVECCATNHQKGEMTFQEAAISCLCKGKGVDGGAAGGAGPCASACAATICAATPTNPDTACSTCLNKELSQGGTCLEPVATACFADTDCKALQQCGGACPEK